MWPRTPIGQPPLPALRTSTVTFSPFAPGANPVASCPRPKPPHPRPRAGSPTLTNPSKRKPTQANFGPTNSPGENSGQRRKQIERPQNKPQLSTVRGAKHRRQITGPLVRQPAPAARLPNGLTAWCDFPEPALQESSYFRSYQKLIRRVYNLITPPADSSLASLGRSYEPRLQRGPAPSSAL